MQEEFSVSDEFPELLVAPTFVWMVYQGLCAETAIHFSHSADNSRSAQSFFARHAREEAFWSLRLVAAVASGHHGVRPRAKLFQQCKRPLPPPPRRPRRSHGTLRGGVTEPPRRLFSHFCKRRRRRASPSAQRHLRKHAALTFFHKGRTV